MPEEAEDVKKPISVKVNRIEGTTTKFTLHLEWDSAKLSAKNQNRLWSGIGMVLMSVLSPKERMEFLSKMDAARVDSIDPPKRPKT